MATIKSISLLFRFAMNMETDSIQALHLLQLLSNSGYENML